MANFELFWNPVSPYSTAAHQRVEYKKRDDNSYTVATTLEDFRDHYTITGLVDNTVYDFRVAYTCDGGTHYTPITSFANFTCPAITTSRTDATLSFSFTPQAVDRYKVVLYEDGLHKAEESFEGPFFGGISSSFTGLNNHSVYVVHLESFLDNMNAICNNGSVPITCTLITDINFG